jgi:Carboxypeptidase regulatory-like domain
VFKFSATESLRSASNNFRIFSRAKSKKMIFLHDQKVRQANAVPSITQRFLDRFAIVVAICLTPFLRAPAQTVQTPELQLGRVIGTVIDVNGDAVTGATVLLTGPDPNDHRTIVTPENGFFQFDAVKPGVPYQVSVSADGFAQWTSSTITLDPGQFRFLEGVQLRIATEHTTVEVTDNPVEVATEQLKLEEKQRVLGIIPNFYVSYDPDAEPLPAKLKFALALKVSVDPVTVAGVALVSGAKQAANTPHYGQGAQGFGKRFGATGADGFTDIMIGGAILPSLLHQDPRYFYQGTGTTKSRIRHAMLSPFISKGDDGNWGPNYSSLGGDLASSAIANLYYPRSNRGAGLVFGNFAIGTAERVGASLAQEFLLGKLTHRAGHIK